MTNDLSMTNSGSPGLRLRPAVFTAREQLAQGRVKLREQHERGSPGIQLSAHLTDLLDRVVVDLYTASLVDSSTQDIEAEIALVPNGGFGRRDVAPYSDVDLMLLANPAVRERVAELARHLTRNICDAGLQLGFSLRTPAEACGLALKDATIFTSLVESRFLAGNERIYERFLERFRQVARRRWRTLVPVVIAARQEERHQYGETAYLLEPNIKRSRGGLRDVQSVRWVGFIRYGEKELQNLDQVGALSSTDRRRLVQAYEFLLRLRNEMHFHAGKAQDLLTRDEQVRLAQVYGYVKLAGMLPVERFMRDFFEHVGDVRYVASNFITGVQVPSRLTAAFAPLLSHRVERDFLVGPVHIGATRKGLAKVTSNLASVLRLMDLANLYGKRIDHRTWEAIRNAQSQGPPEQVSEHAIHSFLSLLSQPGRLPDMLRRLNELRVLEQFIPALQHARCLMQFNDYHKYTVDEHCIRAVECAVAFRDDPRPVGVTYRDLRNKRLLHLALLLHDLGKGYDDDHSDVGARIAAETARRLNLADHETETLRLLVGRHLLMIHMAFREDMYDDTVVLRLAREVGSPDVLQMLYLHSCADLAAVGPDVLNDWKLELLTELYYRTRRHLTGEDISRSTALEVKARRAAVQALSLDDPDPLWWNKQISALPAGYLLTVSPPGIHEVLGRLHRLSVNDVTAWFHYVPERKVCVYLVGAYESVTPGIFHKLTGALTGKGLQILAAEIHTLADELVLDRFYVEDSDYVGEPPVARTQDVCSALVKALTVNADKLPAFRQLWGTGRGSAAANFAELPTRIRFDDSTSDRFTIITIFTYDRRGLLYSIARILFECGLVVHVAKIATYLDQVVDAFYVTNTKGQKIHSQEQLAEIRQRLTAALEPPKPAG
ncbi:MAG: [protein-PII] uridylyltransferase [Pirellulaceae bacterium]